MILSTASAIYGAVVSRRRSWYARHQSRQRRLREPVVSIGSLRVGGSGKTPLVGCVAGLLRAAGERPAILSRGYARAVESDGVTIVSDGHDILADVRHAGDEPLLLARSHPDVPVLVCPTRYLAGRLAEERLGATVHVLDDGFQHLALARDVDLVLVEAADLVDHVLPRGRLREPIAAAARADGVITSDIDEGAIERVRSALGLSDVFRFRRTLGPVRRLASGDVLDPAAGPVLAVAGIARPTRFFDDLTKGGWTVAAIAAFGDHHAFTKADRARLSRQARDTGAALVVMTAKDAVRWHEPSLDGLPVAVAELDAHADPPFGEWLLARVAGARARGRATGGDQPLGPR